jgi:hypothetical protein
MFLLRSLALFENRRCEEYLDRRGRMEQKKTEQDFIQMGFMIAYLSGREV